jgi:ATP-dependent protease ClpP protease subunit
MLIASAGDQRLATPNSMYFYHQPEISVIGISSQETMESNAEFYKWCKNNNDTIMRNRIGMSEEDWATHFGNKDSKYFGVKEAIEYGFCTATLAYAQKPKIELLPVEEK